MLRFDDTLYRIYVVNPQGFDIGNIVKKTGLFEPNKNSICISAEEMKEIADVMADTKKLDKIIDNRR